MTRVGMKSRASGADPWAAAIATAAWAIAAACLAVHPAAAAEVKRAPFGQTPDGAAVEAITLSNGKGVSATILTYGATLQALVAPDRNGAQADIVLGFGDAAAYVRNAAYMGGSVGRYANRIGQGRFTLDGTAYQLALNNNGVAALHGGTKGFDKRIWMVRQVSAGPVASVTLTLTSPDGEEGYPGTLSVTAVYSLDDANALTIAYSAVTDRPTIVNMTNHALFNMAGEAAGRATDNRLQILADGYTPIDAQLLPTGQVTPVAGTAFDFREPQVIETRVRRANDPQIVIGRGYDHNYILRGPAGGGAPRLAARLSDPKSGRVMEILSDQPGLQFYSGNNLTGVWAGKSGTLYRQGDGVALEPQRFPDTPNRPAFGSARLDPGETYRNTLVLRLITDSR